MSSNDGTSSNGVDVRAIGALADLEQALQRFSIRGAEALAAIRTQYDRNLKRLDQRAEDANRDVRRCAAALDGADEDDFDDYRRSLDDAKRTRDEIRAWQRRVEAEYQNFRRDAARFDAMLDRTVSEGRGVLRNKIALLNEYRAIQLEQGDAAGLAGSESTPRVEPDDVSQPDELSSFRLPRGFVWTPLSEIRLLEELEHVQTEADYKKVDQETMRLGMLRLRSEILPRLSNETDLRGSDYFAELDRASSHSYEDGLQRIYEAFFGESHVHLARGRARDQYDITNGRHRIRLAQKLGWSAIPAKTDDRGDT